MSVTRESSFGIKLKQLREAAALSQEELAERSGLSLRGISDLERGARNYPRPETIRMLAVGLELSDAQRAELISFRNRAGESDFVSRRRPHSGLPRVSTSFIGRSNEIDLILQILHGHDARLINLTGPGGVGKTRVALEVARRIQEQTSCEAVAIDLAPVRDQALVLPAIASQLGLVDYPSVPLKDTIQSGLNSAPMVLVLDNLEQIEDCSMEISWLHEACPHLTILATSRSLLRITAEHVFEIEPLETAWHGDLDPSTLPDAVSLFVARATAADGRFRLNPSNADAVVDIVTRLQGMPLAIELAAARIRLWPAADLARNLGSQLSTLTGGALDGPERHRTMRDTIAWSYHILSPREQSVLRALSIFPIGCSLEAAIAILAIDNRLPEPEVVSAISALVDSSLLRAREGQDNEIRYRMLESVREFSLEKLVEAEEEMDIRLAAHTAWCVPMGQIAEFLFHRPDTGFWLNRIGAEYDNLKNHIDWLMERDLAEQALEFAATFKTCHSTRGYVVQTWPLLDTLMDHPVNQAATSSRMKGLLRQANAASAPATAHISREKYEAAAAIAREREEYIHLSMAMEGISALYGNDGELDTAEHYVQEMKSAAERVDYTYQIACSFASLAYLSSLRGQFREAMSLILEARDRFEQVGIENGVGDTHFMQARLLVQLGDLDQAEAHLLTARDIAIQMGVAENTSMFYVHFGAIALLRDNPDRARELLNQARELSKDISNNFEIATAHIWLARTSLVVGDYVAALSFISESLAIFLQDGAEIHAVQTLDIFADIAIGTGDSQLAAWCIGAVDGVMDSCGMKRTEYPTGEHEQRLNALVALQEREGWSGIYNLAYGMPRREILNEIRMWRELGSALPPRPIPEHHPPQLQ